MEQFHFKDIDLQLTETINPLVNDYLSHNKIQGNNNRAVQGDKNIVQQNSNNQNISDSKFTKTVQADKIIYVNGTYLESNTKGKFNGSEKSIEKQEETNNKIRATFIITGTIDIVDEKLLKALEAHLRKISKDTELTIITAEEGSIKITLEGSQKALELLEHLFKSGKLTEVLSVPVEDVKVLDKSSDDNDKKLNGSSKHIVKLETKSLARSRLTREKSLLLYHYQLNNGSCLLQKILRISNIFYYICIPGALAALASIFTFVIDKDFRCYVKLTGGIESGKCSTTAETHKINLLISTEKGEPIKNAEIYFINNDIQKPKYTDENGFVQAQIKSAYNS